MKTYYKAFDKDLKCKGFQYEVGKEYSIPENQKINICDVGFHACEYPMDVLNYYNDIINNRYAEVNIYKDIKHVEDKSVARKIKIKAEINIKDIIKAHIDIIRKKDNKKQNSGDYAQIGSSGDNAQIGSSGNDGVISAIGYNSKIKAKKGSWITLAEYYNSGKVKCVKSAQIDGKILKEDTYYKLKNGEFKITD